MKKILMILVLILFVIGCGKMGPVYEEYSGPEESVEEDANEAPEPVEEYNLAELKQYKNAEIGIAIYYPKEWNQDESDGRNDQAIFYPPEVEDGEILFTAQYFDSKTQEMFESNESINTTLSKSGYVGTLIQPFEFKGERAYHVEYEKVYFNGVKKRYGQYVIKDGILYIIQMSAVNNHIYMKSSFEQTARTLSFLS